MRTLLSPTTCRIFCLFVSGLIPSLLKFWVNYFYMTKAASMPTKTSDTMSAHQLLSLQKKGKHGSELWVISWCIYHRARERVPGDQHKVGSGQADWQKSNTSVTLSLAIFSLSYIESRGLQSCLCMRTIWSLLKMPKPMPHAQKIHYTTIIGEWN